MRSTAVNHEPLLSYNHIHIDEDALAQLPYDRNLSNTSSTTVETPPTSEQMSNDDPYDAHLARSFSPVATRSMTEQEAANNLFKNVSLSTLQLVVFSQFTHSKQVD